MACEISSTGSFFSGTASKAIVVMLIETDALFSAPYKSQAAARLSRYAGSGEMDRN